ncbi:MAG: hypothetical protein LBM96_05990 [Methanobrevibacter sp.]|jgi:hypothetical protein|nr:hypothetical protein [Candidatus Methanoflexus mossambicus]
MKIYKSEDITKYIINDKCRHYQLFAFSNKIYDINNEKLYYNNNINYNKIIENLKDENLIKKLKIRLFDCDYKEIYPHLYHITYPVYCIVIHSFSEYITNIEEILKQK